jgi:hypothetical protein
MQHPTSPLAAVVGYARTPPWLPHPGNVVEVERIGVLHNAIVANDVRAQPA